MMMMTKKELIDEFNAQADACLALAKEISSQTPSEKTDREHVEAIARCNTWRQAALRLDTLPNVPKLRPGRADDGGKK